ncbi:MAG: ATP-binding cassette domain-containing protein [Acidiphilium sp.]
MHRRFGAIEALRSINLTLNSGEVLALLGDNGAGKSTLIKIIAGAMAPSSGTIQFAGAAVTRFDPRYARSLGIETIYQDLALAENLDASANIFLGREQHRRMFGLLPVLARSSMRRAAIAALESLDIHLPDITQPVGGMSGGQRQAVAIARSVYWKARLVIMDEPTAAVGVSEHEAILKLIERLAETGVAVILITHTMADVWRVATRMMVLTRGAVALEGEPGMHDEQTVVAAMLFGRGGAK